MTSIKAYSDSRTSQFVIFMSIVTLFIILWCPQLINQAVAKSPIFSRQVILDKPNDLQYENFANTTNVCDIKTSVIPGKPDLEEVNYLSDGKFLNATLWLSSTFLEPTNVFEFMNQAGNKNESISNNKIVIESKPLLSRNVSLAQYTLEIKMHLRSLPSFKNLEFDPEITISNFPGKQISYTYKKNNQTITERKLWTIANNRVYTLTYTADNNERYKSNLGLTERIIKSISIGNLLKFKPMLGYDIYRNQKLNFSITYPSNWTISTSEEPKGKINLLPPYQDALVKRQSTIVMSIDVDSTYDVPGEDYRVQLDWNTVRQSWSYQLMESSHGGEDKILGYGDFNPLVERKDLIGFYNKEKNFIKLSLDLSKLNFPDQYSVVFFATDTYEDRINKCDLSLFDMTDEIHVPPPQFTFFTTPTSVSLRPGESQNIELQIKNNNAKLNSNITLTNISKGISVEFIPNSTSIPSSGLATSLVRVSAEKNVQPRPYTFEINFNITFPTELTNHLTKERFNNSGGARTFEHSFFTVTVLPEYTPMEIFSNFSNSVISPISVFWAFLAAVGGAMAPLIIYIRKSRKNRSQGNDFPDY